VSADAYCIISNDTHLQEAKKSDFPKVQVLTITEFEKEFKDKN
jgi:predicted nucleic acid-binding protein